MIRAFSPKRSWTKVIVCTLFLTTLATSPASTPPNDPRRIVLLAHPGTDSADQEIQRWQQRLAEKPSESGYWERLGWAYIAKARRTQDAGFYKLGQLTVEAWELSCGANLDARLLRGHIYHNLHRFQEAEAIARNLVQERTSPADFALLSDTLMEQGKLEEAVQACQVAVNLRPGVESYSRIAHLRWLHGDREGAREALYTAIRAAHPRDQELRAWLQTRLALEELSNGHAFEAVTASETALVAVPEFPLALAVKGRALYSLGHYGAALPFLQRAADLNPIPENQWWLADALRHEGQEVAAVQLEAKLRRFGPAVDPRTVALFLATRGEELERAVGLASAELKNRSDIFTHDALAFALFQAGRPREAAAELKLATAYHTEDPRLWFHAGLMAEQADDVREANRCYQQAKTMAALLPPSEQALLSSKCSLSLASAP